jgi:hypothetical protein
MKYLLNDFIIVYFKKADFEKLISIAGQHNPDM